MALNDTLNAIQWWNSSINPWTQNPARAVTDFTGSEQGQINSYITSLYAKGTAASTMEQARDDLTVIRIGKSVDPDYPAFVAQGATGEYYLGFNTTEVAKIWYFNINGTLVAEIPVLALIHEFSHTVGKTDPVGSGGDPPTEAQENSANWDFEGSALRLQNSVAQDLSLTDNIQASYGAALGGTDTRRNQFTLGANYTENQTIEIVRIGNASADNQDMSARTDDSRDLIFGLGGDDTIKSGKGNDYVYGGAGKDKIWGGEGNDVLVGQGGDDEFRGEKGDDVIWGGEKDSAQTGTADGIDLVDYSSVALPAGASSGIAVSFAAATGKMTVADGEGGTDTLASIDRLVGTGKEDSFTFTGSGSDAKVDMTDVVDGYALTTQEGVEVRVKSIETFVGGDSLTTFIGAELDPIAVAAVPEA